MAKSHLITPFPDNIDRDRFGDYLSGFADGESSFVLAWINNKKTRDTGSCRFVISLRSDDGDILRLIQSYWQCGRITDVKPNAGVNNARPTTAFRVSDANDLARIVVPHFDRHPLYAKKRNDFEIWKHGVKLMSSIKSRGRHGSKAGKCGLEPRWSARDVSEFQSLVLNLKSQRVFESSPIILEVPVRPENSTVQHIFGFGA